jgi:hypothetical protein
MMEDSTHCCLDRVTPRITTEALHYLLIAISVLLGSERVQDRGCSLKLCCGGGTCIESSTLYIQVHILEFEGGIVRHCACILARPKQKEEGDRYHVCDFHLTICTSVSERLCHNKDYTYDWDRLHSTWKGILSFVRLDLTLDPKVYATVCIFARV